MDIVLALVGACLGGVIPAFIFVFIAYRLDRYEREPIWLLTVVFLWGAIPAIIVSLVFELFLDIPLSGLGLADGVYNIFSSAVVAPIVEEFAKAAPLVAIFYLYRREFDGLMDGLLYGALVGHGFALTENVLYFLGAYADGGLGNMTFLIILRAFVFGLNHALFTSAFGVGLAFTRYSRSRFMRAAAPFIGLSAAIGLHALHNFFVSFPDSTLCFLSLVTDYLGVFVWLILVFFALRQERQWITAELKGEVETGLIPPAIATAAASSTARMRERARIGRERGKPHARTLDKLYNTLSELAFKKRQLSVQGEERGNSVEVARLRGEVQRLMIELA